MTKKDFKVIADAIKAAYPRYKLFADENSMSVWYEMLKNISYKECSDALKQHMLTSPYPPSIADITKNATQGSGLKTWSEAWNDVLRSIRHYGSSREREALNSLDKVTRQAAQSIGYRDICMSENPDVIRGQFRSAYEQIQERQSLNDRLPKELRDRISRRKLSEEKGEGELKLSDNGDNSQS